MGNNYESAKKNTPEYLEMIKYAKTLALLHVGRNRFKRIRHDLQLTFKISNYKAMAIASRASRVG